MFNYASFNVWHEDFPQNKVTDLKAMGKRGAITKGYKILKSQRLIPLDADKHGMKVQEASSDG